MARSITALVGGAALCALTACGGPGLPPAGPAPGDVDVGYDTSKDKDQVTGSVTSMTDEKLGDVRPLRIDGLLRGRVPGLQVIERQGGRATYRIRGVNSLLADQEPLFVVDGMQVSASQLETALSGLSTGDIRQIDVLKDVASTSIYGMRGAGGVIIITTRR